MIMLKTAKKQQNKRKKLMIKEKNKIEIEAFKLEAKKSQNLIKNAKKYIKKNQKKSVKNMDAEFLHQVHLEPKDSLTLRI